MWLLVAIVAFILIVVVVVRKAKRDAEKDIDFIRKQANCPHLYDYRMGGKRLCGNCGKELPRRKSEVI